VVAMKLNKSEQEMKRGLLAHVICYAVFNLIQIVVWGIFTPELFFWPLWSLLAWGIGLAFHVRAVYAPSREVQQQRSM
jgi:hypothetical protein